MRGEHGQGGGVMRPQGSGGGERIREEKASPSLFERNSALQISPAPLTYCPVRTLAAG